MRHKLAEVEAHPSLLEFDGVGEATVVEMWDQEIEPFRERLKAGGAEEWPGITAEFDGYSTREFLEHCGWSEGAIDCFALLGNLEALMNSAFLEVLREEVTDRLRHHRHRPCHPQGLLSRAWSRDRPGVMLASYTWPEDAHRWGSHRQTTASTKPCKVWR